MGDKVHYKSMDDFMEEGIRLFGVNMWSWRFVCPSCGHIASVQDWKDAGAEPGEVAFSCVGRHIPGAKSLGDKPGPCDYTGGGLIRLNPVTIEGRKDSYFQFDYGEGTK